MATTRPRITITLTERQHELLRSLGKSSGQSMSAFVVEFLDMALPTLERMAVAMQAISQAKADQIGRIREQLDEAQSVFEPLAALAVAQSDLFWGRIEESASVKPEGEAAGGQARRRSPTGEQRHRPKSPPTNRGVTPTPGKPVKPKLRAASSGVRTSSPKSEKRGSR